MLRDRKKQPHLHASQRTASLSQCSGTGKEHPPPCRPTHLLPYFSAEELEESNPPSMQAPANATGSVAGFACCHFAEIDVAGVDACLCVCDVMRAVRVKLNLHTMHAMGVHACLLFH